MATRCEWCQGTDTEYPDLDTLCEIHQAEYEGMSVDMLRERDRVQLAEWLDTLS